MKYYIKHVTAYQKQIKTRKGAELAPVLEGLERIVLSDQTAVISLCAALTDVLNELNLKYPRPKDWRLLRTGVGHISIRPADSKGLDDDVAHIIIEPIRIEHTFDGIEWQVKRLFHAQQKKGGKA